MAELDEKYGAILKNTFLFCRCSQRELAESVSAGITVSFKKGECIRPPQDFGKSLGIVLEGRAAAVKQHNAGCGVRLNSMGEGSVFNAASVFEQGEKELCTVKAASSCSILFLNRSGLERLFLLHPQTAVEYITFLSDRVAFLNNRIDEFVSGDGTKKLSTYLCGKLSQQNDEISVSQGYVKLAQSLNMGRATLYRSLGELESAGIIKKESKKIIVTDREKLCGTVK